MSDESTDSAKLNGRVERLLSAVAYGIRRQTWGDSLLEEAFGDDEEVVPDDALDALNEIARRCGIYDFDAH